MRGSTPCACAENQRYGGNTACVVIEAPGARPIILDLGTGLRFYGLTLPEGQPIDAVALLSHLHWDHVQGLPFFTPVLAAGSRLSVYGPAQEGSTFEDAVRTFLAPPFFPVTVDQLGGSISFHEFDGVSFDVDGTQIDGAWVPHVGPTLGYRVTRDGVSVAYVSDHQQPGCGSTHVDPAVLDLCRGVDVLIHDAQYTTDEFAMRSEWGHCTIEYAVHVAQQAGAKTLVLFHHDPLHHDGLLDDILGMASEISASIGGPPIVVASEGLSMAAIAANPVR